MIVSDAILVMLPTHAKFAASLPRQISETTRSTEVLVCPSADGREGLGDLVRKAAAAGGRTYKPAQDHGVLDGHVRELVPMPAATGR